MKQLGKSFVTLLVVAYLISAAASFGFFRFVAKGTATEELASPIAQVIPSKTGKGFGDLIVKTEPGAPLTSPCPINGVMYTDAERKAWEVRRPMLVMIENHQEARPQSGLSTADVVYESVAEGAITRFMGIFYCDAISNDTIIGPVRSARTYFLDWASEYSKHPIYVHVGGANTPNKADALGQIQTYGWGGENDLNQFGLSVKECWRDYSRIGHEVATEHTMYCSTEALWKIAEKRGWAAVGEDKVPWDKQFTPWKFADPKPQTPQATFIAFDFWKDYKDYSVRWDYDAPTNMYKRSNGGAIHKDLDSDQQITVRDVVIMFTKETGPIDDHLHMLYGTIGTGKAMIFQNGQVVQGSWSKKDRNSRTIFTDAKGKEIEFARGKIWIENLPIGDSVSYQ